MFVFVRFPRFHYFQIVGILVISAAFSWSLFGQADSGNVTPNAISAADETAIKAVAEAFFTAFSKKDISGIEPLWSTKSTYWKGAKEAYQKTFAETGNIAIKAGSFKNLTAEKDFVKLRFTVDFTATGQKSGAAYDVFDSKNRVMFFVKDEGSWKIQQDMTAEKDLALRVIAEKNQAERDRLLKNEPELVNSQLALEFRREGGRLFGTVPDADLLEIWRLALRVSTEIGDKKQMANALDMIGYKLKGKDEKLAAYQKALVICDEIKDSGLAAKVLIDIAIAYRETGEMEVAWDYATKAKLAAEDAKDSVMIARVLMQFGILNGIQGNYVLALENFESALAIFRESGIKSQIAGAINNTGIVYEELGNYSKAIETFKDSIRLSEEIDDKYGLALSLENLGNVYNDLGDNAKAMDLFQRSIAVDSERGEDGAGAMINVGNLYKKQGMYDQAKKYLGTAFSSFEKAGAKGELALIFASLGEIEQSQGNYRGAIENQQRALAINREIGSKNEIADTLVALGMISSEQGDFIKAASYFQEALRIKESIGSPVGIFQVLLENSNMQIRQGDYAAAKKTAEQARSFYEKIEGSGEEWEIYSTLAQASRGLGQNAQARENLGKAIAAIEKTRSKVAGGSDEQEVSFGLMTTPYFEMAEILVSEKRPDAALSYVERAKARTLVDAIQTGKIDLVKSMTVAEQQHERRLKDELTSLNAQIAIVAEGEKPDPARRSDLEKQRQQKRLEFEDLHVRLYSAHPELRIQRGEMKPISLEETAALLPDDKAAMVEFVVAENKTFLFVITKEAQKASLKVFTVDVKDKDLGRRVEAYRSKLASGDLDFQNASRELYDLLLKPAQAQLAGKTNLIIVPDGPLWDLPFQALRNEKNKYLVEQVAISYAPSLTALKEMSKKAKARKPDAGLELLAFGNPIVAKATSDRIKQVFMSEKLEPLPESERLVNELGKMYGANRSKVYIGNQAREETAKTESPKYRIVQFATHGILNNVSPMYSHLVLSQNEKNPNEDGLLEAWEMKDLDLKADMVILSACDTARGKISNGEGVIGMSWALFIAGTPTTVASQWKVESSSTTDLMLEFHRGLLAGKGISKAEALRRAELKVMRMAGFKHPSYWAGFVLVGDGS